MKTILEAGKDVLGRYPEFKGMITPGDSEFLANAGIPSVIFGPGDERLAHATNEWIAIDDILTATKLYAATIMRAQTRC